MESIQPSNYIDDSNMRATTFEQFLLDEYVVGRYEKIVRDFVVSYFSAKYPIISTFLEKQIKCEFDFSPLLLSIATYSESTLSTSFTATLIMPYWHEIVNLSNYFHMAPALKMHIYYHKQTLLKEIAILPKYAMMCDSEVPKRLAAIVVPDVLREFKKVLHTSIADKLHKMWIADCDNTLLLRRYNGWEVDVREHQD